MSKNLEKNCRCTKNSSEDVKQSVNQLRNAKDLVESGVLAKNDTCLFYLAYVFNPCKTRTWSNKGYIIDNRSTVFVDIILPVYVTTITKLSLSTLIILCINYRACIAYYTK